MELYVKWITIVIVGLIFPSVNTEGVIGAVSPLSRSPIPSSNNEPAALLQQQQQHQELCPACVTGCRTISGLFTRPQLPPGYSLVAQVPKGACRLVVAQLKFTRNFIAIRNSNGTFILNGDPHDMGRNHEIEAAGTRFIYRRQDTDPETITASGPLTHPVDIMMIYNQPNPGIKYEFLLPAEQVIDHIAPPLIDARKPSLNVQSPHNKKPHTSESSRTNTETYRTHVDTHHRPHNEAHRHQHNEYSVETRRLDKPTVTLSQSDDSRPLRRRRRKFAWKITGMTNCTRTCGGGIQYPVIVCIREHSQSVVLDRRCTGLERPRNQTLRCNTDPCTAYWGGTWSACSATCGPGVQTRILECLQEISATLTIRVKDGACMEGRPATTRSCEIVPCEPRDNEVEQELPTTTQWHTEPWSQCSVTCGSGQRTRMVLCNGRCRPEDRPAHIEPCYGPPCPVSHTYSSATTYSPAAVSSASISWWLVTDWGHCSQGCGTGTQSRWVTCPTGECDQKIKPEDSRACASDKQCGGKWYIGPWGPCSDSCTSFAKQIREVICVAHIHGQARVVNEMICPTFDKPVTEQSCEGTCPARWFTGDWSPCDGDCPNGQQKREVRCLEHDGKYSVGCTEEMPPIKRSCHCPVKLSAKTDYTSRESSQAQDEPSQDQRDCTDQFSNCVLVVQARLCQYPYYKTSCCNSCRRSHHQE